MEFTYIVQDIPISVIYTQIAHPVIISFRIITDNLQQHYLTDVMCPEISSWLNSTYDEK